MQVILHRLEAIHLRRDHQLHYTLLMQDEATDIKHHLGTCTAPAELDIIGVSTQEGCSCLA